MPFNKAAKYQITIFGVVLIELVVTLMLIGILLAVTIPKIISFTKEATDNQSKAIGVAFYDGIKFARTVWVTNGYTGAVDDLQVFGTTDSGTLDFNANGWPSQHWNGAFEANPSTDNVWDCISLWKIMTLGAGASVSHNNSADYRAIYIVPGKCKFERTANTAYIVEYNSNNGAVNISIP